MACLRFPNPVSDIKKFFNTYQILYRELKNEQEFDIDDITEVLINNGLVTSSGATGEEAKKRSFKEDRSMDRLYNQSKMYSELFRMLGWFHTKKGKLHFHTTELGDYIAGEHLTWEKIKPLVINCILSIVFPNPFVENEGIKNFRPFPIFLELIEKLDGFIFRDELIITALTLEDDRIKDDYIENYRNKIINLREEGKKSALKDELANTAKKQGVQPNTLQNYTRFPLGVLRSTNWCETEYKNTYNRALKCYKLTDRGEEKNNEMREKVDIRFSDLNYSGEETLESFNENSQKEFDKESIINFVLLSHYNMLEQSGYDLKPIEDSIEEMKNKCIDILEFFDISSRQQIFYSPYQQTPKSILKEANQYEKKTYMEGEAADEEVKS